jgi:hypothetical protein
MSHGSRLKLPRDSARELGRFFLPYTSRHDSYILGTPPYTVYYGQKVKHYYLRYIHTRQRANIFVHMYVRTDHEGGWWGQKAGGGGSLLRYGLKPWFNLCGRLHIQSPRKTQSLLIHTRLEYEYIGYMCFVEKRSEVAAGSVQFLKRCHSIHAR